jgi:preprotein translocase subunit SecA
VKEVEAVEGGLMQEAQKFFVLTQTDNLWKEHLQVRRPLLAAAAGRSGDGSGGGSS